MKRYKPEEGTSRGGQVGGKSRMMQAAACIVERDDNNSATSCCTKIFTFVTSARLSPQSL